MYKEEYERNGMDTGPRPSGESLWLMQIREEEAAESVLEEVEKLDQSE